jgi:hypothetical protein
MSNQLREFSIVYDASFRIEGKQHQVSLSVSYHPKARCYWIDAITETGFDLCSDNGYFKSTIELQRTKLRSEASIALVMLGILDSLAEQIRAMQSDIILTSRKASVTIRGVDAYSNIRNALFFSAANIQSKQSGQVLSWYEHDVFKQGELVVEAYRTNEGQLRFRADERDLYDLTKLKRLHDSDAFQSSKFAFFFYNECRRLLGIPVTGDAKRMSGLFDSGRAE